MKYITFLIFVLVCNSLFSQKIENVTFIQQGEKILITYDIKGGGIYYINCFYTLDDGVTYTKLNSVTGDVGSKIKSGNSKKIFWDVFQDTDGIRGEIKFKITADFDIKIFKPFILAYGSFPLLGGYLFGINGNFVGKRNTSLGLVVKYYIYDNLQRDEDLRGSDNFGIDFALNYKLLSYNKYQCITSVHASAITFHDYYVGKIANASEVKFLDGYSLVINNIFNNLVISPGLAVLTGFNAKAIDINDIYDDYNFDANAYKMAPYIILGIGYKF